MQIVGLTEEHEDFYFRCLEDWDARVGEQGHHKACWYRSNREQVGVRLAVDEENTPRGMIQYVPADISQIEGRDLYFIQCIWIHPKRKGEVNFRRKGVGRALLEAAEEDVRSRGARGIAAWGIRLPFWMRASFYKKHGYKPIQRDGISLLVWKPFNDEAEKPSWILPRREVSNQPGVVTVTGFISGWCPALSLVFERAKRACAELGDSVVFIEIDTSDRATFLDWGIMDGVYVDGKRVGQGPPMSYEKMLKLIRKKINKLK